MSFWGLPVDDCNLHHSGGICSNKREWRKREWRVSQLVIAYIEGGGQTTGLLVASMALVNDVFVYHELVIECLVQCREVDILDNPQA